MRKAHFKGRTTTIVLLGFLMILAIVFAMGCQSSAASTGEEAQVVTTEPTTEETTTPDAVTATKEKVQVPVLWGHQVGLESDEAGLTIAVDTNGNSCAAGYTIGDVVGKSKGNKDILVTMCDTTGKHLWTLQSGSPQIDQANAIVFDEAGDILVCGHTYGTIEGATGTGSIFLQKISKDGQVLWTKQFGGSDSAQGTSIVIDAEGNLVIAGGTSGSLSGTSKGMSDAIVIKLTPTGDIIWMSQWGTEEADVIRGLALTSDGLIHVIGDTDGSLGKESMGETDYFYTKLDANGQVIVSYQYGTEYTDRASRLVVDGSGNIYLAGSTDGEFVNTGGGGGDAALIKSSPEGQVLWQRQFGTSLWDGIHGIIIDKLDPTKVIVSGCGNWDRCEAFIVRYDSEGNEVWNSWLIPTFATCGREVAMDNEGNLYQTGGTHGKLFTEGEFKGVQGDLYVYKVPSN